MLLTSMTASSLLTSLIRWASPLTKTIYRLEHHWWVTRKQQKMAKMVALDILISSVECASTRWTTRLALQMAARITTPGASASWPAWTATSSRSCSRSSRRTTTGHKRKLKLLLRASASPRQKSTSGTGIRGTRRAISSWTIRMARTETKLRAVADPVPMAMATGPSSCFRRGQRHKMEQRMPKINFKTITKFSK